MKFEAGPSYDEGSEGFTLTEETYLGNDMAFTIKEALVMVALNEQRLFADENQAANVATSELLNARHRLEKESELVKESLIQLDAQENLLQQSLARTRGYLKMIIDAKTPEDMAILLQNIHQRAQADMKPPTALHGSPTASQILMSKDGRSVRGGTFNDLVAFLTHQTFYSSQFTSAFLLTYKSFTTPELLFRQLLDRWYISDEALEEIVEQSSTPNPLPESHSRSRSPSPEASSSTASGKGEVNWKRITLHKTLGRSVIAGPSIARSRSSSATLDILELHNLRPSTLFEPREGRRPTTSLPTSSLVQPSSPTPPFSQPSFTTQRAIASTKELLRRQIRLRVIAVLKLWFRDNWSDFERCSTIIYLFLHWLQAQDLEKSSSSYEKALASLRQTFTMKLIPKGDEKIHTIDPSKVPLPILLKNILKSPNPDLIDFFSLDPIEVARQMSIAEQKIFQAIESRELLNQNWNRANKIVTAPNATASWVMNSVVCCHHLKTRMKRLGIWIKIAQACRELRNLNGVIEVLSGLGVSSVYRLRKTWGLIDIKLLALYEEMKSIMSQNQNAAAYRTYLRSLSLPCVPYIGFVLTDLTFTDEGMPNFLDRTRPPL